MDRIVSRSEQPYFAGLRAYFFVPILLGFALGVHRAGFGRYFSAWGSIVVWEVHFIIFWGCCMAASAVLLAIPGLRSVDLRIRLVVAALLGAMLCRPIFWITYQLRAAYALQFGADARTVSRPIEIFDPSVRFLLLMVELYGPNIAMWTVSSWALTQYLPIPFLHCTGAATGGSVDNDERRTEAASRDLRGEREVELAWIGRVKPEIGRKLRWLKAEGHYVQVRTSLGCDLIHYRLSDAVDQLGHLGLQVHRSYWVAYDAIREEGVRFDAGSIRFADGEEVPVGPSYLMKVRETFQARKGWHEAAARA
jgi:hypothetical protein